jgi:competence protein ComFA
MEKLAYLAGRQWISQQKNFSITKGLTTIKAISNQRCNRCGTTVKGRLPNGKTYCRACIGLGRVTEGDFLVRNESEVFFQKKKDILKWRGQLTPAQKQVSIKLVENFKKRRATLVHAVTGAGKTEMLFAVIAECLSLGQRCCIASPRIDVINELYPRIQEAFQGLKIGKYHGREFKEPELEQLTLCTTHQLLKFYHAFDLLIIDEADSFPYIDNSQLHFGAKNAIKTNGIRIYLTATPTRDILQEVEAGKIRLLKLNRRFHGGLLPIPREKLFLRPFLNKGHLHPKLIKEIIGVIKSQHPLLLFVPRIEQISLYLSALKKVPELHQINIEGVYAADKKRLSKVQQFRDGKIQLLVTTTILERGVTFKHVWVIIVQADDAIFTTSSLVQIAGRVGRAQDDVGGLVLFCYQKYTRSIQRAVKQIKELNK